MENSCFAPDNATRLPFSLSQHGAWLLLGACEQALNEGVGPMMKETIMAELQTLYAWFTLHCDYDDWQDDFDRIEARHYRRRSHT